MWLWLTSRRFLPDFYRIMLQKPTVRPFLLFLLIWLLWLIYVLIDLLLIYTFSGFNKKKNKLVLWYHCSEWAAWRRCFSSSSVASASATFLRKSRRLPPPQRGARSAVVPSRRTPPLPRLPGVRGQFLLASSADWCHWASSVLCLPPCSGWKLSCERFSQSAVINMIG